MFTDEELDFIINGLLHEKQKASEDLNFARRAQYFSRSCHGLEDHENKVSVIEKLIGRFRAAKPPKPSYRVE
jgi:hypothetical protein